MIEPIKFAKGGKSEKTTDIDIIKGIQNLLGANDEEMEQLLQVGIKKYGSIGKIGEAIQESVSNLPKGYSYEDVANAVMTVFSPEESQMFKCGGKMQQLVAKHSKGKKVDCGCGGTKITFGAEGDKLPKQRSEDKTVTIIGMGTPEQVIKGTYSYPSTNGEFEFGRYGKTANVWENTGGFPKRYADEEWIRRHPIRQMIPLVRRKPAPEGFFENLGERVTNRFPEAKFEDGGIVKGQDGAVITTDTTNPLRRKMLSFIDDIPALRHIQQGFNNFSQSAPGKVLSFFIPNPKNGAIGATAPAAKIKVIPEGVSSGVNLDRKVRIRKEIDWLYRNKQIDNGGFKPGTKEFYDYAEKALNDLSELANGPGIKWFD